MLGLVPHIDEFPLLLRKRFNPLLIFSFFLHTVELLVDPELESLPILLHLLFQERLVLLSLYFVIHYLYLNFYLPVFSQFLREIQVVHCYCV